MEYPIVLVNDTLSLHPMGSWKTDRMIKLRPSADVPINRGPTTHGETWLYAEALYESGFTVAFDGVTGWRGPTSGIAAQRYVKNVGIMNGHDVDGGCLIAFFDPTTNAMDMVREIAFQTALYLPTDNLRQQNERSRLRNLTRTEWKDLYLQSIPVKQTTKRIIYRSQYVFLSVAVAMTLCAMFCVLALSFSWWHLGREVFLSPIEIAKAFAAPSLHAANSNSGASAILKELGTEKLSYGVAWDSEANHGGSVATLRFDRVGRCDS